MPFSKDSSVAECLLLFGALVNEETVASGCRNYLNKVGMELGGGGGEGKNALLLMCFAYKKKGSFSITYTVSTVEFPRLPDFHLGAVVQSTFEILTNDCSRLLEEVPGILISSYSKLIDDNLFFEIKFD